MALQGLASVTIGVPDVEATGRFYADFGLTALGDGRYATTDGGEQLRLVPASARTLLEIAVASDAALDLTVIGRRLGSVGMHTYTTATTHGGELRATDPASGASFVVTVPTDDRLRPQARREHAAVNAPGHIERRNARADAAHRRGPVAVRKLSHAVLGSPDAQATERFLVEGLGFKVSDRIPEVGAFLRCSTDHHNLLVQQAPITFLHHTAWLVDDVDEVGRGGSCMVERDLSCHVWGPGRHHIGSNYFWYLRDPAGNFAEYAADLDAIDDDTAWQPGDIVGPEALVSWGPPCPMSFLVPEDLAEPAR